MVRHPLRQCTKCNEKKPPEEFFKKKGAADGISRICKTCHVKDNTLRRKKDPDAFLDRHLKYMYGIGLEDFYKMLEEQDGKCAICGDTPSYRLCVDHRHDTMKVRGLLCRPCNKAIGQLGDTPEGVKKAYDYLKNSH